MIGILRQNEIVKSEKIIRNLSLQIASLESVEKEKRAGLVQLDADIKGLLADKEVFERENSNDLKKLESKQAKETERYSIESKRLADELKSAEQFVKKESADLEELRTKVADKTAKLKKVEETLSPLKDSEQKILGSVNQKEQELDVLSKDISEKSTLRRKLSNDVSVLTAEKNELIETIMGKQEKEEAVKDLNSEIGLFESIKETKKKEITGLDNKIEELKSEQVKVKKENIDILKQLETREGDVSLKESWLLEKEETLKSAKTELEKFHGKRITSVNF